MAEDAHIPGGPGEDPTIDLTTGAAPDQGPASGVSALPTGSLAFGARSGSPRLVPGMEIASRYQIELHLASGGMGQVYRARDLALGLALAIKTIRPEIAANPAALRMFKQEILLARSISHPNVCRIFDLGCHAEGETELWFLSMELLAGVTLSSRIRERGRIEPDATLAIAKQLAAALDAAHRAGIVHRDLKCANVMIVPSTQGERVVITDFGLAHAVEPSDGASLVELTGEGDGGTDGGNDAAPQPIVGTPAYMAPEQVLGQVVGPPADLYAFGVVLFEMLTGRLPFEGERAVDVARARLESDPPPPGSVTGVESPWDDVVLRLLSRDPASRYPTASDAVLAIEGRPAVSFVRHTLPPERDVFVGRTAELEEIAATLTPGALVTLLGPGGIGKTRLARKYALGHIDRWPGGVWFCDLSEARTPERLALAVATSLDVTLVGGDPIASIAVALADRGRALVILDNFEQVAAWAEETLGRWMDHAPECGFLVTSQIRLGLGDERTVSLASLDPTTTGTELFLLRARTHRADLDLEGADRRLVAEIVELLDGIPLAIELAAPRLRILSLSQLRERLGDRFRVLTGATRGRHSTLRATLDWSWDLLPRDEKVALAQLAVFEDGFSLEAAEDVVRPVESADSVGSVDFVDRAAKDGCVGADVPSALVTDRSDPFPLVLDLLQALVDKSWIEARNVSGTPRFSMYQSVHEYLVEKLESAETWTGGPRGLEGEAQRRHAIHFANLGSRESIRTVSSHGGISKLRALRLDLLNLEKACERAAAFGLSDVATSTLAAAWTILERSGPYSRGTELADLVLRMDGLPDAERARALRCAGAAHAASGDTERAIAFLQEGLGLQRKLGNRRLEAILLGHLGVILSEAERSDEARAHYEAALVIHREVGNRNFEGVVLGNLGILNRAEGRDSEALQNYEEALRIHRESGDLRSVAIVLGNIGSLLGAANRPDEARRYLAEAWEVQKQTGYKNLEINLRISLASVEALEGNHAEARRLLEESLDLAREIGSPNAEEAVRVALRRVDELAGG
ncbi:MAG: tetratricopeptide repeat protein [Candidatus Eisenbacteria bacterium]|uniref:Tetratricopeptide repeat protein n=1 Tax=Eiseniibacteriota bacterium TaxID=2212470 RepID=A0A956SF40_UNCEI|nr:tetratricopeptide repeat protein [Candidatus Eisenbacteria bacterium]